MKKALICVICLSGIIMWASILTLLFLSGMEIVPKITNAINRLKRKFATEILGIETAEE